MSVNNVNGGISKVQKQTNQTVQQSETTNAKPNETSIFKEIMQASIKGLGSGLIHGLSNGPKSTPDEVSSSVPETGNKLDIKQ